MSGHRTAMMDRAIHYFCQQGYRVELSVHPNYTFTEKATGRQVVHSISTLVDNYKQNKADEAKERARQRRLERKK